MTEWLRLAGRLRGCTLPGERAAATRAQARCARREERPLGSAASSPPLSPSAPTSTATGSGALHSASTQQVAAEEDTGLRELLRSRPLTARLRRLLLQRLDGVVSIYRLAAAIADAAWPLRLRWYRAMPMDAALALPDGRSLFVVREGRSADRTAFAKRLWRLREGPRPGAYLLLVPDAVRLRHTARLMAAASAPAFLALERDAVASGTGARIWRTASGSPLLSLREVLAHVPRRGAWPREEPLARATVSRDVRARDLRETPDWMLPAALGAGAKRVLDLIADWPWIGRRDLAGLAGVSSQRVSQVLAPAGEAGLLTREAGRFALSDRGLALLARRDRSAV